MIHPLCYVTHSLPFLNNNNNGDVGAFSFCYMHNNNDTLVHVIIKC